MTQTAKKTELIEQQDMPLAPVNGQTSMVESTMVMMQRAIDNGADPSALEKIMDLQERVIDKAAEQAYAVAMMKAQKAMPKIAAESSNQQTKSKYAKLEVIIPKITPVYTEAGFSLSFGTEDSPHEGYLRIVCDVMHEQGHSKRYHFDLPLDDKGPQGTVNKTGIHASGSTISYGRRYLTAMIFNLAIGGEDNDGNGNKLQTITEKQAADLEAMVTEYGADLAQFCKFLKLSNLSELPAINYTAAVNALKARYQK